MAAKWNPYDHITNQIIESLEKGVRPWQQPWNGGEVAFPIRSIGKPYRGVNVLVLWLTAAAKGYRSRHWFTFKQAKELGGMVNKGEKGTQVIYAGRGEKEDEKTGKDKTFFFMKTYPVFNGDQIRDLPDKFRPADTDVAHNPDDEIASAKEYFKHTGAKVAHGGSAACYTPDLDKISMPPFKLFRDAASYYSTLGHETIHWTKHPSRLDRNNGHHKPGSPGYAREELVAEIGAAFLCCDLKITLDIREDHASYVKHWLGVLREDNRAIFKAASDAQKAIDYLHGLQPASFQASRELVEVGAADE